MYKNTGAKIISFASILSAIGYILSIILGIVLLFVASEEETPLLSFLGIIIAVVGCILSWLSNLLLAGFGELIDNSAKTVALLGKQGKKHSLHNPDEITPDPDSTPAPESKPVLKRLPDKYFIGMDCEICEKKDTIVYPVILHDEYGTRNRLVCPDCYNKYDCEEHKKK